MNGTPPTTNQQVYFPLEEVPPPAPAVAQRYSTVSVSFPNHESSCEELVTMGVEFDLDIPPAPNGMRVSYKGTGRLRPTCCRRFHPETPDVARIREGLLKELSKKGKTRNNFSKNELRAKVAKLKATNDEQSKRIAALENQVLTLSGLLTTQVAIASLSQLPPLHPTNTFQQSGS